MKSKTEWTTIVIIKNNIFFVGARIPVRLAVGVMAFMICFISYMLRANIAIGMLAMVKSGKVEPDVSLE